jgi:hypothetical protein
MAAAPQLLPRKPAASVHDADQDFAPCFVEKHRLRYTPGVYTLRCVAVRLRQMFGAHKCELEFEFPGTTDRVCAYLHMGRGPKPAVGDGSNYTKLWRETTGKRSTRMSAKVFRWTYFECEVADVTKNHDGNAQPAYSVVRRIIRAVQK